MTDSQRRTTKFSQKLTMELRPEKFMNRVERLSKMTIPQSNSKRVIVRSNNAAMGFRFDCYDDSILRERVDKETFNKTVRQATKICENNYLKRRKEESSEFYHGLKYIVYVALFLLFVSIVLLSLRYYRGFEKEYFYAGMLTLFAAGGLAMLITIILLFLNPKFTDIDAKISKDLKEFITQENADTYLPKMLRWAVDPNFFWLELWLLSGATGEMTPLKTPSKSPRKNKK